MFDGLDTAPRLLLVEPGQLTTWAPRVRSQLGKMADRSGGRYLAQDILAALASGRMQLWLVIHGPDLMCVTLTELQQYPRRRALRLIGLVGHQPRKWRHLLLSIEAVAKDAMGCDLMEAFHEPRFGVILPGYETTHWFGEKRL